MSLIVDVGDITVHYLYSCQDRDWKNAELNMDFDCNVECRDELDAFASYIGDDLNVAYNATIKSVTISFKSCPRTAANSSICFVSCISNIFLSFGYPHSMRPRFSVSEVVGMVDDGLELTVAVEKYIDSLPLGDFFLFPIAEYVMDILDNKNDGECMICAESLKCPPSILQTSSAVFQLSELAVKTFCGHHFHLECLAKWAAISLTARKANKSAKSQNERDELLIRAQDGQLRASQQEMISMEQRLILLTDEIVALDALKLQLMSETVPETKGGKSLTRDGNTNTNDDAPSMSLNIVISKLHKATTEIAFVTEKIKKLKKRFFSRTHLHFVF